MRTLFLLAFSFVTITSIQAQNFTNFTTNEGLVNNTVNCLSVDPTNDDLWFGTQDGISHFNGLVWNTHNQASDSGIVHNTITTITVLTNGDVWIGSDFGASKYDGSSWTTYTEADGLGDDRVKCIFEDANGIVWFGNNDGVSMYDGAWTSFTTSDGLPFGGIHTIDEHSNGDLWMGSGLGGIVIYNGTVFTGITENEGLLNDKVRSIALGDDGRKWIGTSDGVSQFQSDDAWGSNHTTIFTLPAPDTLNPIEDLKIDSKGNVWAAVYVDYLVTEGGISWYNGGVWTQYDMSDGLIGPVVRQLAIDSNDDVWVATSTGVSQISNVPSLGVQNVSLHSDLILYPNPVNTILNIKSSNAGQLQLYNSNLQLVNSKTISQDQSIINIDVSDFSEGIYVLKLAGQTCRFMVTK